MGTTLFGLNDGFIDALILSDSQEIIKGSLFVAGLLCAALAILLAYVLRARLVHRRCCAEERLLAMSTALGVYDPITAHHSRRVAELTQALLDELGLSQLEQRIVLAAAHVHDIGKTAISEAVLSKPGPLTGEEWQVMRAHPELGADLLASHGFCSEVVRIVRHHHERWDGSGYPAGLVGYQIPIGARVLAVVDGFDAMTNDRPYRPAMRLSEAIYALRDGSGTQWDPAVVEAFLRLGIPSLYTDVVPLSDGLTASGRAGRRLGTGVRTLARSSAYLRPMAG